MLEELLELLNADDSKEPENCEINYETAACSSMNYIFLRLVCFVENFSETIQTELTYWLKAITKKPLDSRVRTAITHELVEGPYLDMFKKDQLLEKMNDYLSGKSVFALFEESFDPSEIRPICSLYDELIAEAEQKRS